MTTISEVKKIRMCPSCNNRMRKEDVFHKMKYVPCYYCKVCGQPYELDGETKMGKSAFELMSKENK